MLPTDRESPGFRHGEEVNSRIGPITMPDAGGKQSGYFTFDDALLGKYQWPYFAVVGHEPGFGPGLKFLLTAGIHAAEYTGTLAALRLASHLQPEHVHGTIVIIPLLNRPGFFERSVYVNPEDGQNLNRAFLVAPTAPGASASPTTCSTTSWCTSIAPWTCTPAT